MKLEKYVKDICSNVFDANEIVWLLKGREDMTAYDFVCECILNVAPENISAVLEDCLKPSYSAYGKKKNLQKEKFFMDRKSLEVVGHIVDYFKEYLPNYTVMGVGRKSFHPDEAHLYVVLSKKDDGSYGFCDCWDERKKTLNRGRYGIEFLDSFVKLFNGGQCDGGICYAVYSCTDQVKNLLFITEDEERAGKFCEDHDWKWEDDCGDICRLIYEVTR